MTPTECVACGGTVDGIATTPTGHIGMCSVHALDIWADNQLDETATNVTFPGHEPLDSADVVDHAGGTVPDSTILPWPVATVCEECDQPAVITYEYTEYSDWVPATWIDPGCWLSEHDTSISACIRHSGEAADTINNLDQAGMGHGPVTIKVHPAAQATMTGALQ